MKQRIALTISIVVLTTTVLQAQDIEGRPMGLKSSVEMMDKDFAPGNSHSHSKLSPQESKRQIGPATVFTSDQDTAWGQQDTLQLPRLSGPVEIDGHVDEPAWESIPTLPMTQFEPTYGAEPGERSEIRVAYDDEAIYISGRMYEDSGDVRANTLYRDEFASGDLMAILIDSYFDRKTATWFCVNPAGSRIDQIASDDGREVNVDWNTYWSAAATQDEDGWYAEMRIPFSCLGFQDDQKRVVMGLEVYRYIGSTNERLVYPDEINPKFGRFFKPSRMQPIELSGVNRQTPVYVTPYALGGWRRNAQLNDPGTDYDIKSDYEHEAGVDVRFSPSPNTSLDVTVNTDFAQVEADNQQINLTRFPIFLQEKRQFFQERSSVFNFNLGGDNSRLFHSRRIGLVDGQPIRVLGGARFVSRQGGTDIGILNMQTDAEMGRPGENFGVARVKQRVFNENSTVGGMLTSRVGLDGSYNVAAGADALVRVVGEEYATLKFAHTFEDGIHNTDPMEASRMVFGWERRTEGGFSYSTQITRSGGAFHPGVGYTLRRDFSSVDGQVQYLWYTRENPLFRSVSVQAEAQGFQRNDDGSAESAILSPSLNAEFNSGSMLSLTYHNNYESVLRSFSLSPEVTVPAGNYRFHEAEASFRSGGTTALRPSVTFTAGQFYGGNRIGVMATPQWIPSRHLTVGATYNFNAIRFPGRDLELNTHLLRLRLRAAYDTHLSLSSFWQYNSLNNVASLNARLRYNFRDGTDLWVVYNETLNTDRNSRMPVPPRSQGRAIMVKYTHALIW
jgi:hypothetical protein